MPHLSTLFAQLMCQALVLHFIITMYFNKLDVSTQETGGCFAYVLGQRKLTSKIKFLLFSLV